MFQPLKRGHKAFNSITRIKKLLQFYGVEHLPTLFLFCFISFFMQVDHNSVSKL